MLGIWRCASSHLETYTRAPLPIWPIQSRGKRGRGEKSRRDQMLDKVVSKPETRTKKEREIERERESKEKGSHHSLSPLHTQTQVPHASKLCLLFCVVQERFSPTHTVLLPSLSGACSSRILGALRLDHLQTDKARLSSSQWRVATTWITFASTDTALFSPAGPWHSAQPKT